MSNKAKRVSNSGSFVKGFTPWNKGMTYDSPLKAKMNLTGLALGRTLFKGKKRLDMSGMKHWNWKGATLCKCGNSKSGPADNCRACANVLISQRMKGNKNPLGHRHSAETRRKLSENRVNNPSRVFKDTKIERVMENLLLEHRIVFEKQSPLCQVTISDFYIPEQGIAIFCDGCYWHGCESHRSRKDKIELNKYQNRTLRKNGIIVLRFWEHDLNEAPEKCIDIILATINPNK